MIQSRFSSEARAEVVLMHLHPSFPDDMLKEDDDRSRAVVNRRGYALDSFFTGRELLQQFSLSKSVDFLSDRAPGWIPDGLQVRSSSLSEKQSYHPLLSSTEEENITRNEILGLVPVPLEATSDADKA